MWRNDQPEESTLGDRYWRSRGGRDGRFRSHSHDADGSRGGWVCRLQCRSPRGLPFLRSTLSPTAVFSAAAIPVGFLSAAAWLSATSTSTIIRTCISRCGGASGSVDHLHTPARLDRRRRPPVPRVQDDARGK